MVRNSGVLGIEKPHRSILNLVIKLYRGDDTVGEEDVGHGHTALKELPEIYNRARERRPCSLHVVSSQAAQVTETVVWEDFGFEDRGLFPWRTICLAPSKLLSLTEKLLWPEIQVKTAYRKGNHPSE
ncbi:hypothetical protein RJ641_022020 [Dillenia turbinata]|uniref:Uncharacterized protein n=1 Tax=Dillenia turbinata TaxID=194707 RepID=A0AAN8YRB5_9MAGN